ncbi:MAG TPA: transcriptional repressor [Spirochaetota bacterium]|nr:transcriptional repressor [Spirochaetota bacterium]HPI90624.1 transcriptional repressor [Spirochaetota bacterium]HPR46866.1 transcriptional repressor [Spirochaetota bacterium]
MNTIKETLLKHDISPSYHRLKIYEYLLTNRTHPTVDMIFSALINDIPTLSKTTVYNTLNSLSEKGLVLQITIENNEVRYDATVDFHGHFKCLRCGNLYDINLDEKELLRDSVDGHKITEHHYYFKGICKNCR